MKVTSNGTRSEAREQEDKTSTRLNRAFVFAIHGRTPTLAKWRKFSLNVPRHATNLRTRNVRCHAYVPLFTTVHQKYIDDIANRRKSLVSTGDRSAKIRTYNYPQGRVTDHRIGYTTHDLQGFVNGDIQAMIDALTVAENAEKLKENEL